MEARRLVKRFTFVLVLASSFVLVQSTQAQSFNVIHNFTGAAPFHLHQAQSARAIDA